MERKDLIKKWSAVLEHEALPSIQDNHRKEVTAVLLENQQVESAKYQQLTEDPVAANQMGDGSGIATYDPVLISLVRRSAPQMIAYDLCGVQPMTQPTGLVFALRSKYGTQSGDEALFNEANGAFSGDQDGSQDGTTAGDATIAGGMTREDGELLGTDTGDSFNQMAFSVEKIAVEAKTRKLKAEYTLELAQDLKAVHGLDAEAELSNILSTEILAEINREVIRSIYYVAETGAVAGQTATTGEFDLDVDANGRWSVEKFKGLMFQIEREANTIGHKTRRGRGNFVVCSADVASALQMAGVLDYSSAIAGKNNLNVDDTSTTFAGILNGKYKVYIDPYMSNNLTAQQDQYFVVGYKGASATDAGLFYCPYVPLQMMRAIDPNSFQPKIAFQTRYGMVANPFVNATGALTQNANQYFRKVKVSNIM